LRRGSGMIGSGTILVAAVVSGALACASDTDGGMAVRAFGAGFGTGTVCGAVCAKAGIMAPPASDAAISKAKPARKPLRIADGPARFFKIRFKAASW
jgi:hypothetical protein